ncbi:MAG: hypothetical protein ACRD0K_02520 [Egibacteraceae bacterium]
MSDMRAVSRRRAGFLFPPTIPDDLDAPGVEKARGVVRLPHHVQWTRPDDLYDLDDRRDRLVLYELVLQQGLEDDVRYFIDVDELIDLWRDLYLPPHVRIAWEEWLASRGGVQA